MPEKKKKPVNLKFENPDAGTVHIAGNFNSWNTSSHPLKQGTGSKKKGAWLRTIYLEPGEYEYRYIVDGAWCDDPNSSGKRINEFGGYNCVLRV
jgi:1,4-alpha-glucan branching enzyme